jgi:hypothetical protein
MLACTPDGPLPTSPDAGEQQQYSEQGPAALIRPRVAYVVHIGSTTVCSGVVAR